MKGLISFKKILEGKFQNPDFKKSFEKVCLKDCVFDFFKEIDLLEYIKEIKIQENKISIFCTNSLVSNKINTLKEEISDFLKKRGNNNNFEIKIKNFF
jgi:translation initiation factor RLI1